MSNHKHGLRVSKQQGLVWLRAVPNEPKQETGESRVAGEDQVQTRSGTQSVDTGRRQKVK